MVDSINPSAPQQTTIVQTTKANLETHASIILDQETEIERLRSENAHLRHLMNQIWRAARRAMRDGLQELDG